MIAVMYGYGITEERAYEIRAELERRHGRLGTLADADPTA